MLASNFGFVARFLLLLSICISFASSEGPSGGFLHVRARSSVGTTITTQGVASDIPVNESIAMQIQSIYGPHVLDSMVPELETSLFPVYISLPQTERGRVGPATARYALHRLFVHRLGWHVKGIAPTGGASDVLSPRDVLKDFIPPSLQVSFEHQLRNDGLGLRDLAVFAALVEYLAQREAEQQQRAVHNGSHTLSDEAVGTGAAFSEEMRLKGAECQRIKSQLLRLEDGGTGRVRLTKLEGAETETLRRLQSATDELRDLGALDEATVGDSSLIVPNYVGSVALCTPKSRLHSMCCPDECDGLMRQLEHWIAAPEAKPKDIAAFVGTLPSPTLVAPRNLSTSLLTQLDQVAAAHGSAVPLHGRHFAEWMHKAFPRECIDPEKLGVWRAREESVATADKSVQDGDVLHHTGGELSDSGVGDGESLPWDPEEQLLIIRPQPETARTRATFWTDCQLYAFYIAMASAAVSLGRIVKSGLACAEHIILLDHRTV